MWNLVENRFVKHRGSGFDASPDGNVQWASLKILLALFWASGECENMMIGTYCFIPQPRKQRTQSYIESWNMTKHEMVWKQDFSHWIFVATLRRSTQLRPDWHRVGLCPGMPLDLRHAVRAAVANTSLRSQHALNWSVNWFKKTESGFRQCMDTRAGEGAVCMEMSLHRKEEGWESL